MTNEEAQGHIAAELADLVKVEPILQFFAFMHLPPPLRLVSAHFAQMAIVTMTAVPRNPERTAGLRKLLESKDCAVRAVLYREPERAVQ